MSKMKLLLDVVVDVRTLADSLQTLADAMAENETHVTESEITKEEKKPSKKSATKKEYTLEDVRGVLAEKSKNGLTTEVKALIEKFGGEKLSDIKPENYAVIMKEGSVLGNE